MATEPLSSFYDHFKALYDWIKGNSTDIPKVQQSGSIVEVIQSISDNNEHINNEYRNWSASDSGTASLETRPLNVSGFKTKIIIIRNNHDIEIELAAIRTFTRAYPETMGITDNTLEQNLIEEPINIPAGSFYIASPDEFPFLKKPMIGLSITTRTPTSPTSGSIDVEFLGGRV